MLAKGSCFLTGYEDGDLIIQDRFGGQIKVTKKQVDALLANPDLKEGTFFLIINKGLDLYHQGAKLIKSDGEKVLGSIQGLKTLFKEFITVMGKKDGFRQEVLKRLEKIVA